LVLRKYGEALKDAKEGKLVANLEGPVRVVESLKNGAYRLEYLSNKAILRTWNATHLKFYYS